MGLNYILCSNMQLRFKQGQLDNISFYTNPDATFFPTHEIFNASEHLEGFNWRSEERPLLGDVVYYYKMEEEDEPVKEAAPPKVELTKGKN